jgi:2-amino-4-hydroxy-6-hydroxymethyldihydropteridine diphosphokinase
MKTVFMNDEQKITRAVIGLGSNIPDRHHWLCSGLALFSHAEKVEVVAWSDICESAPIGENLNGDFLNAVIVIDTTLGPSELLRLCHEIEDQCGRDRNLEKISGKRNRTLDCDVIFYGDMTRENSIDDPNAEVPVIPHPHWSEREFVVLPLLDVFDHLTEHQKRLVQDVTKSVNSGSTSCRKYGKMLD